MSEAKFTPGPWRHVMQPVSSHGFYIEMKDVSHLHSFIGDVGGGLQPKAMIEANARLIAAAPEMYEFLNGIVNGKFPDHRLVQELLDKVNG